MVPSDLRQRYCRQIPLINIHTTPSLSTRRQLPVHACAQNNVQIHVNCAWSRCKQYPNATQGIEPLTIEEGLLNGNGEALGLLSV